MTDKEKTAKLMLLLFKYAKQDKLGVYMSFETHIPLNGEGKYDLHERVDAILHEPNKKIWRFYELKVSLSDFHSKAKLSFQGNYNYFVMPQDLFDKVKDEIPSGIGVLVADDYSLSSSMNPTYQELKVDESKLMECFSKSLDNNLWKYYQKFIQIEERRPGKCRYCKHYTMGYGEQSKDRVCDTFKGMSRKYPLLPFDGCSSFEKKEKKKDAI